MLDQTVALLERAAGFGLPQSGWGFAYEWRRLAFTSLLDRVRDLVDRWAHRLNDFDGQIAAYDALPPATPDDDRFRALQAAELLVAATLDPLPAIRPRCGRTSTQSERLSPPGGTSSARC